MELFLDIFLVSLRAIEIGILDTCSIYSILFINTKNNHIMIFQIGIVQKITLYMEMDHSFCVADRNNLV